MIDPNSIDLVIYHKNCTDGFCAAWAAWKLLGSRAKYVPAVHGDEPPDVNGKHVAILDFAYSNAVTKKMIKDAASLIVLDHHKSAMADLCDVSAAKFDMTHSGAMLAWNFFHVGHSAPKFVKYVEDRDLWKWELSYSKEFSAAFDMVSHDFEDFARFEDDSVFDDAVKRGSYILAYSRTVYKKIAGAAVHRKLDGLDVMVVNSSHWMSEIGNVLAHDCDCALIWFYNHTRMQTQVSLRSFHDNVDVSDIARRYGGGGHEKSAGFTLPREKHIEDIFDA